MARIDVLPVRGGERFLRAVFEPLGYEVETVRSPLDEKFPEWGESPYFSVTVRKSTRLAELLTHLYVLIPVFDNRKHCWVGEDEMEKLLAKSEGWLAQHPEKEEITRRYLRFQPMGAFKMTKEHCVSAPRMAFMSRFVSWNQPILTTP